jgi:heme exporter protein C
MIGRISLELARLRTRRVVGIFALGLAAVAGAASLWLAPPDAVQGDLQRLMYVHVPAAWISYLAFVIVFASSIAYLVSGRIRWDHLAHAAAELGVVFTALAIVLGSIWGRPTWGVWWTWDPRLTTTAILLLIYLGYLAVRRLTDDPTQRARWSAVVGVVGFVDVPIVHLSVVWWRSLHQGPSILRPGGPVIAGPMLATLLLALAAFTAIFLYLLLVRLAIERRTTAAAARAVALRRSAERGEPVGARDG